MIRADWIGIRNVPQEKRMKQNKLKEYIKLFSICCLVIYCVLSGSRTLVYRGLETHLYSAIILASKTLPAQFIALPQGQSIYLKKGPEMSQLLTKYLLMLTATRCGQRRYSKILNTLAHNYEDCSGFLTGSLKGLEVSMEHLSAPLKVAVSFHTVAEAVTGNSSFWEYYNYTVMYTNPFGKPNKKCCLISMCCLSRGWIPLC